LEGGPNTVRTSITHQSSIIKKTKIHILVHQLVVQNNIPVVFFEDTGHCCDLFAKAFRVYNEHHQEMESNLVSKHYEDLKNQIRKELKHELVCD
jgi:hypothetical protein